MCVYHKLVTVRFTKPTPAKHCMFNINMLCLYTINRVFTPMYLKPNGYDTIRAVESVHKISDSDSSIFKTPTPIPS
jgi:hypothetical protein